MAATLVVGTFAVTTTTIATTGQSAFAYSQKKKGGGEEIRYISNNFYFLKSQ